MKHLPKHLRPRYRYLAVDIEGWPDLDIDRRDLQAAVWAASRSLLGDPGSAAIDPTVMRVDVEDGDGWAIVRVRREGVDRARAAIACVTAIGDASVRTHVTGVSGTIRACERKFASEPRSAERREVSLEGRSGPGVVRGDRVDLETDDCFTGGTAVDVE